MWATERKIEAAFKKVEAAMEELRVLIDPPYLDRLTVAQLPPGWMEGTSFKAPKAEKLPDKPAETREWVFEASDPAECSHDMVMVRTPGKDWQCSACGQVQDKVQVVGASSAI